MLVDPQQGHFNCAIFFTSAPIYSGWFGGFIFTHFYSAEFLDRYQPTNLFCKKGDSQLGKEVYNELLDLVLVGIAAPET